MQAKASTGNTGSPIGIVVIGRNEGDRLRRCLKSIAATPCRVVYVDSGSTDGSLALAQSMGTAALALDLSIPFCAARARNAGYQRLLELDGQLRYVQFVDADCELVEGWLPFAADALECHPDVAAVAGWLHERTPDASIYNRLAELEWNASPPGPVDALGGICMIRRAAFDQAGGFDPTITAGEEPELCQRLIHRGWRLLRIDRRMATHDLAMTRFAQWWLRMVRSGYGSMDVACRFGVARFSRNTWRILFWTAWLSAAVAAAAAAAMLGSATLVMLTAILIALWPLRLIRIILRTRGKGHPWSIAVPYAFLMAICFLPQFFGQVRYIADRLRNRLPRLLEYKTDVASRKRG